MSANMTVECAIHFERRGHGASRQLKTGHKPPCAALASGRVPRITRLMALAIRFEGLVRAGAVPDYAALARLGHVSRARLTQIMNLLLLAPDIQEQILFLPRIDQGRDPIQMAQLQRIALTWDWRRQRRLWQALRRSVAKQWGS